MSEAYHEAMILLKKAGSYLADATYLIEKKNVDMTMNERTKLEIDLNYFEKALQKTLTILEFSERKDFNEHFDVV